MGRSRELTTTNQYHSTSCNLASYVSCANFGAMGNSNGSIRKRTGPLPPLANLVEMERNVDNYGRAIAQGLCILLPIPLIFIWCGFWELLGY
jgi:hypothetical protein